MICLATVTACGINQVSVRTMRSETQSTNCYFHVHIMLISCCFGFLFEENARQSRSRLEMFHRRSSVESGAFSLTHDNTHPPCGNSFTGQQTISTIDHHQRGQPGEPGYQSCSGDTQQHILNFAWPPTQTLHVCRFSKIFYFYIDPSTRK